MKKNLFTKILACSMALAMLTGTALTVSAVETELGGLSPITSSESDTAQTEYDKRLEAFQNEMGSFEFLENDEYYYWLPEDETVEIMFCKLQTKEVTVPSEIDGKPVKTIGWSAFYQYKSLEKVTLPDTISTLSGGFAESGIKQITIPKNVTNIYFDTFFGCENLENIYVDIENPVYSSLEGLLTNKLQNQLITVPNGREGSFTVPSKIDSLQTWGAFRFCSKLTDITLSGKIKVISTQAFDGCTNLKSIRIADGTQKIGSFAFYNCTSLSRVYIPKTVSNISYDAFANCDKLTIYGEKDSYAETYAKKYNIPFEYAFFSNTSTISANTIIIGNTVTVNASAVAGKGNYTYAVYYKKNSEKKWTVKQDYSENPTVSIKPAKATDYQICVKVKDGSGKVVKKYFDLSVVTKLSNTSYISSDSIAKGSTVIAKCSAKGGKGNYTYAVYYKKAIESKWTLKQDFNKNSDVIVRPANSLEYDICIKAKDEMGTVAKKYFKLNVSEPSSNTNTSAVSASVINLGESVTINCSSTIPDCRYKVLCQSAYGSPDRIWKILQDYSPNTQITFTPYQKETYRICITAQSPDGHTAEKLIFLKVE